MEVALSSLELDRLTKARLYAEAGVEEYWILDLDARYLERRRTPVAGRYTIEERLTDRDSVSPQASPSGEAIQVVDLLP